jgi:radical SAM protein with 4Fe4S-binding SPASM domain
MKYIKNLIYRFKYNNGQHLKLEVPVDITMELSSHCNLRCGYCYHADQEKLPFNKGFMNYDTAISIIDQAADLGVHSLKFNWRGESSLHPNFYKIVKRARDKGTFTELLTNTNFNFKGKGFIKKLEAYSLMDKVKISIDSLNESVYETQRARGDFENIVHNIDDFFRLIENRNRKTKVVLQAVRTNLNRNENLRDDFLKRWPKAEVSIRECVDGRVDDNKFSNNSRDNSERKPCKQAFARLIISHDGKVYPCCPAFDDNENGQIYGGNVNKHSIYDIWNSYLFKKLRTDLKSLRAFKNRPICKNCSSFETFKNNKSIWGS